MSTPTPTSYASTQFIESAGTVLINPSAQQLCILHLQTRNQYVLPKGRRNIGENRHNAAIRETEEETGYKCHLLPITLESWQPPENDDGGHIAAPVRYAGVREPFMVVHRMLKDGSTLKMVWWYLAAVDEGVEAGAAEKQFEVTWVDFEEAGRLLSFGSDREVIGKAAQILKMTFGDGAWSSSLG